MNNSCSEIIIAFPFVIVEYNGTLHIFGKILSGTHNPSVMYLNTGSTLPTITHGRTGVSIKLNVLGILYKIDSAGNYITAFFLMPESRTLCTNTLPLILFTAQYTAKKTCKQLHTYLLKNFILICQNKKMMVVSRWKVLYTVIIWVILNVCDVLQAFLEKILQVK